MKQNITLTSSISGRTFTAQDYQRGWELAQKEYLRQEKQARLKATNRPSLRPSQHLITL